MKNTFTLLLSTALLISACGSGGKNTGESAETTVLTEKDSIAVNQILVPRGIMVKGDILLLVADNHNGADTLFYAYGLPDGKFLFGQGVTGQGLTISICRYFSATHKATRRSAHTTSGRTG